MVVDLIYFSSVLKWVGKKSFWCSPCEWNRVYGFAFPELHEHKVFLKKVMKISWVFLDLIKGLPCLASCILQWLNKWIWDAYGENVKETVNSHCRLVTSTHWQIASAPSCDSFKLLSVPRFRSFTLRYLLLKSCTNV